MHLKRPCPTVLIVDDDALVRLVGADLLLDAGYEVIEAADAEEALEVLETCPHVEVVFTDVEMPGRMDGYELAAEIAQRWPDIGVLVTSGRRFPTNADHAGRFVSKPYSAGTLVNNISACLQR